MERAGAVTLNGKPKNLVGPELAPGSRAPEFRCADTTFQPVTLADTSGKVRIFSVVPSLDTPICDMQTKRFNDAVPRLEGVHVYSISTDLPFAERRYQNTYGTDNVKMLSDHYDVSFGQAYGVLLPDMRILTRAIFVLDQDDVIRYVEYVPEVSNHPDYEAALSAAGALVGLSPEGQDRQG
jgi:thiol peroxidase